MDKQENTAPEETAKTFKKKNVSAPLRKPRSQSALVQIELARLNREAATDLL